CGSSGCCDPSLRLAALAQYKRHLSADSGRMDAGGRTMSDAKRPTDAVLGEPLTSPLHLPHAAATCPKCLADADHDWWSARPEGTRLVGLVVARDGMPSVTQQREDLTRFGVPIEGFRHPAPEILESWADRLSRLLDTLQRGDVLVVEIGRAACRERVVRSVG